MLLYVFCEDVLCVFLEFGCGVGNTVFLLFEFDVEATVYCCDFSKCVIDMVFECVVMLLLCDCDCVKVFVCDVMCESLLENVFVGCVDVVTMVFALSAML